MRIGGTLATGTGGTVTIAVGDILNDNLISLGTKEFVRIERGIFADRHQAGAIALSAGSTLSLGSTVTAAETVLFGADTSLVVAHSFALQAALSGFAKGDSIDLQDVLGSFASFSNDVLTVEEVQGGATTDVAALHLIGSYTSSDFVLAADGHGGTVITTTAPLPASEVRQTVAAGATYDNSFEVPFAGGASGLPAQDLAVDGVYVDTGTLLLSGGSAPSGVGSGLLLAAGGTVENKSLIEVSPTGSPASIVDAGVLMDAGTIADTGSVEIAQGGALTVAATGTMILEPQGGTLSDAGVLTNAGTFTIEAGAGATYEFGFAGYPGATLTVQASGSLINTGVLTEAGGSGGGVSSDEGSTLLDFGVITNSGTISLDAGGGTTYMGFPGLPGSLFVMQGGTLANSGSIAGVGGTLSDAGVLINTGTILMMVGHSGPAPLTVSQSGTFENDGLLSIPGAFQSGGGLGAGSISGVLLNRGSIALGGGVDTNGTAYGQPLGGANGGVLTVQTGGSLINSGTITLLSGTTKVKSPNPPFGGALVDAGTISDTGAIIVAPGPGGGGTLTLSGLLNENSYLLVDGQLIDTGTLAGDGTVRIGGTFATGAGAKVTISARDILNDGLISIGAKSVARIERGIFVDRNQAGVIALGPGSTLSLGSTVTAAETVLFRGSASLTIAYSTVFAATLGGFSQGESIDLQNVQANAVSFANGVLTLEEVQHGSTTDVASLHLVGSYTSSQFALAADGHGGTVVTTTATLEDFTAQQTVAAGITYENATNVSFAGETLSKLAQELVVSGVYVNAGTVTLNGGIASSGAGGRVLINTGGSVENNRLLVLSPTGLPASILDAGQLTDAGTIADTGSVEIAPSGTVMVAANGTLVLEPNGGALSDAGVLINAGTLTVEAGRGVVNFENTPAETGAVLTVQASGTLVNAALLIETGGGGGGNIVPDESSLIMDAGVLANSGTIVLDGGLGPGALLTIAQGGSLGNSGSINFESGVASNSQGPGATLTDAGLLTNTGTISVDDHWAPGTIEIAAGGTLSNAGLLSFASGNALQDAGVLVNQGRIVLAAGTVLGTKTTGGSGSVMTVLTGGTLDNSGTITLAGFATKAGTIRQCGTLIDDGEISGSGTIIIAAGVQGNGLLRLNGFLNVGGDLQVSGTLYDAGYLSGNGTVRISGTLVTAADKAISIVVGNIINDDLIGIGAHDVARIGRGIAADPGGVGAIALASGSAVSLYGTVAAAQTVLFGADTSLVIVQSSAFAATLSAFAAGDSIDLQNVTANAASFANGVLTLAQVHAGVTADVASLHLVGSYTASEFALAADGHGGTVITTTAAAETLGVRQTVAVGTTYDNTGQTTFTGKSYGFLAQELVVDGVYINAGTLALTSGGLSSPRVGAVLSVSTGGTLEDRGLLMAGGLTTLQIASGGTLAVADTGTLVIAPSNGTLSDAGVFINAGTVSLNGGNSTNGNRGELGTILTVLASGTLANAGLLVDTGGARRSGSLVDDASTLTDAGVLTNSGTIVLQAGLAHLSDYTEATPLLMVARGGSLENSGSMEISTGTLVDSGAMSDAGAITVAGVEWGGGTLVLNGSLSVDGYLLVSGQLLDAGTLSGTGTVRVGGTFATGADATVTISVGDILNDRLISIGAGGVVRIERGILADAHQTGTIALGAGSTLSLGSTVTAAETVAFGATASLAVAQTAAFAATLAGFAKGDSIDLQDVLANTASFAHGVLTLGQVHSGITAEVARLILAGSYMSSQFALAADGHGGTAITTTATLAASW